VGFQISLDLVVVVGNSSDGIVFSLVVTSVVGVGVVVGVSSYFSESIFFATYFALFGSVRATYRARMSSSVSILSSKIVPKVVVGTGVVFAVTLNTGYVSLPLPPAVRLTFS
jgi:small basic protein